VTRFLVRVLLIFGAAAWPAPAADFWETKKYTDWTDKEVEKILKNSPWAQRVDLPMARGMGGGPGMGGPGGRLPGGGGPADEGGGAGGPGGGPGGAAGGPGGIGYEPPPMIPLYLRWMSALPVKQAIARMRFGAEAATSPEATQLLSRDEPAYVVAVEGLPVRALGGPLEQLKDKAQLRVKGAEPIAPANVQGRQQQGVAEVYFYFPKSGPGGREITLEDKEVEFLLKLRLGDVRRKFQLKKMVYNGKLEI
jgi:hypothetical protein